MIGYEPGFRPQVRALVAPTRPLGQTKPVVVPAEIAASTGDAVAASSRNRNLALLVSAVGAAAGGSVAYGVYSKKKDLKATKFVVPAIFSLFNLAILTYVLIEG